MRKFAVFDIDGTIFRSSLYIEIVYELARRNIINLPQAELDTAYEHWASRNDQGYITYRNQMVDMLESQIKGMNVEDFEKAASRVIDAQVEHVYVYTRKLIRQLKKEEYFLIALSGSQQELVARFAHHWKFDAYIGQTYHQKDGVFTGHVSKTHEAKDTLLKPLMQKHQLTRKGSIAVGDTEGDIEMLAFVERPIAFNPNRKLYKHAVTEGWEIIVERKDMIYKFGPGSNDNYELLDTE
jgi:HAD superfamily hydrolase (TIGR01490 family)